MKTVYLSRTHVAVLAMATTVLSSAKAMLVNDIFSGLLHYQREFNGTTYAVPQINYLHEDFLIQTPNIWGQSLSEYNTAISTAAAGEHIDKTYLLPTCLDDSQCMGERACTRPTFLYNASRKLCTGPEIQFQLRLYQSIVEANHSVDITTLQPEVVLQSAFSDGAFTPVIQRALVELAIKANFLKLNITVRLLQGEVLPITAETGKVGRSMRDSLDPQTRFLQKIVNNKKFPQSTPYFRIYLGAERSCYLITGKCNGNAKQKSIVFRVSWNHGKVIVIDGDSVITGGQNFWGKDYLQKNPVNDLNIQITGPVAEGAQVYADNLWAYVRSHQHGSIGSNVCVAYENGKITNVCPDVKAIAVSLDSATQNHTGIPVRAMFVSKLNNNVLSKIADASELARMIAFNRANATIMVSQQALFFKDIPQSKTVLTPIPTVLGNVILALANAIDRSVNVSIVTSNLVGMSYSSEVSSAYLRLALLKSLVESNPGLYSYSKAAHKVDSHLSIKTIRYSKRDSQGSKTLSHHKLWIVDEDTFYVGSHNIYPSALQQFGVIVSNKKAAAKLKQNVWDPLWENSKSFNSNP
jgi:hypothetical protein